MSYLEARKNILSIISNSIVTHIKDVTAENDRLVKYAKNDVLTLEASNLSNQVFTGIPNNLIINTTIYADCGNDDKGEKCLECLKKFDVIFDDNYIKNMDTIKNIKDNECFGVCSCKISNVSLSSHLIFTTGVNINSQNIDTNIIYEIVKNSFTNVNKESSTTENTNWKWLLCGLIPIPGAAAFGIAQTALATTITAEMELEIKKVISNMSTIYAQTINQLITTSQEFIIKGTGVKVHNISIDSLNDITMSASISDCSNDNCLAKSLNSITNQIISEIQDSISYKFTDMFEYAFKQNKNIIIAGGSFILITMFLWFFLLFKKAATKK